MWSIPPGVYLLGIALPHVFCNWILSHTSKHSDTDCDQVQVHDVVGIVTLVTFFISRDKLMSWHSDLNIPDAYVETMFILERM